MLTRDEIIKRTKDKPWVSPFEKIIGLYSPDDKLVQIYEYHARNSCYGAAAWAVYHYKKTSPLIKAAYRDGARDIFTLKLGRNKLNLKPSFSSAGIEAVELEDENIRITYAGLAGGGVGSSLCRALAKDVTGVSIHSEGGGDRLGRATLSLPKMLKVQVGIDDTDKAGAGATWSLANEIGYTLNKKSGVEYLNHTLVQLYPGTPERTTNCVATVLTFGVKPDKFEYLKRNILKKFKEFTLSEHTGLAYWIGISIPDRLFKFTEAARKQVVSLDETKEISKQVGIQLVPVTGERGLIGAVAAIGYAEELEKAARPAMKPDY
jgi:methanogenesis imperfect marker protein 11